MRTLDGKRLATLTLVLMIPCSAYAHAKPKKSKAERHTAGSYLLYVGTYTVRDSKGIYVYRFRSGRLTPMGPDPLAATSENPSFLAADPTNHFLYAVNESDTYPGHSEQKSGGVSAFSIDRRTGRLNFLNMVPSGGGGPCFVSLDHTGKYVLVANYSTGSVAVFPVRQGGKLGQASAFVQHTGHSVDVQRQEGPHAHDIAVSPDNRFALAADLGLDKLLVYRFDSSNGSLAANDPASASVTPGLGPRHFVFDSSGDFVYLLSEVKPSVTVFAYDKAAGNLKEMETVPALQPGFVGEDSAAEVALGRSGRFLYASNRGEDSIAVFGIDPHRHTLKSIRHVPTLGKTPRNFAIDPSGRYLLAANQDSDNIVIFQISPSTGLLKPTGQVIEVPSPVSLVFVPER